MKSLISLVLVLAAGSAVAGEGCNLQIGAGLRISPDVLAFYDEDKTAYQIKDHRYLVVDGKPLALDSAQQALVAQYDQQVRALVPEVRGMALEGIDLAIVGVTTAFDGLLGERNKISTQLGGELNHLKGDVRRYFDNEIIHLGREKDGAPELFGQYFETRMERIMETSVQDSIGTILIAMGKEILSSGGDIEAFGARMDRFGKTLEAQMQTKAAELEMRGASLCRAATAINATEDQLRNLVPDIRALDLIRSSAADDLKPAVEI
ncbi:MAG: hypothetical protein B0W54_12095 [Cellvibrio sp. 79]|nr:MAG: hypothetical protein B0W54_12095 [Cellvibrio sp. 79]